MLFYDKFKDLCKEKGLKPSRAAIECGFSKGSVSRWKNDGKIPNREIIVKIAEYFGVTVDYLLGNEQNKNPPTSNTETWTVYNFEGNGTHATTVNPNNVNALKKLLNAAGELTPEQIEALIKVAETMK